MDINRMRLGLMYIFAESSSLSKKGKLQLVNFIENATEHQLKALALDGEIHVRVELDEQTCEIIDERFQDSGHITKSLNKASLLALESVTDRVFEKSIVEGMDPAKAQKKIQKLLLKNKDNQFMMGQGCMKSKDATQVGICRKLYARSLNKNNEKIKQIKLNMRSESKVSEGAKADWAQHQKEYQVLINDIKIKCAKKKDPTDRTACLKINKAKADAQLKKLKQKYYSKYN